MGRNKEHQAWLSIWCVGEIWFGGPLSVSIWKKTAQVATLIDLFRKKHHHFFRTTQKRTNFFPQSLARRPRHGNQKYCSAVPLPLHFVPMRCVASHQHRLEEWGATIRHPPNGQPSEQGRMSPAGFFSVPWECWMYQNTPKKTLLGFYAGFLRLKSWWLKHSKTLFVFQLLHQYPRDFARKMDISFRFLDRGKDMSLTSATGSLL